MFTWKPIYAEIAARLEDYQFKNAELVDLMVEMHRNGLKPCSYMDQDDSRTEFPLEEIDPFTFFANFNRGITDDNRRAILEFLKERWDLESPIPDDFAGLPLVNLQKSWFMSFKPKRKVEHVPTLWEFYLKCHEAQTIDQLDTEAFDACTALRNVGLANLTMGMFWARPDLWLSLDKKNIMYAKSLGILNKPKNGAAYLDWLRQVQQKIDVPTWAFSHESHVRLQEQGNEVEPVVVDSELAEPYCRLFDNVEHACEILDFFKRVLTALGSSEDDAITVTSFLKRGRRGGQIRVICGGWAVFGYRRRANDTSFQVLLPEGHAAVSSIAESYRFTARHTGETFVLGWVDDQWFYEHWEEFWSDLVEVLHKVREVFKHWNGSPSAESHSPELFTLITDEQERPRILGTPLTDPEDSEVSYWLLAPGEGASLWEECYERRIGTIGWDDLGDLTQYETKERLADAIPELYPDNGATAVATMLWYFSNEIKPGDVIFAKDGLFKICGWGVVSGDYQFEQARRLHKHTLPVEWKSNVVAELPEGMQLSGKTLTPMDGKQEFLDEMARHYPGVPGLGRGPVVIEPESEIQPYTKSDALADLFMSEEKLDRIVKQLKRKKNIVLQGAPGTGKTFVARRIAYLLMGERDPERAPMVQFHQSTAYEDFIQGYRPDGNSGFLLKNGGFYELCEKARRQSDRTFVYIIDEINRGNLSKVFGELLMLIEHDKRKKEFAVPLTYASSLGETFYVPANVHLIGTMNTADRSLSMVDYALRRRFSFIDLEPSFESPTFAEYLKTYGASTEIVEAIRSRMKSLNERIGSDTAGLGRGYRIGHSFFVPTPGYPADEQWMEEVIECEVIPLLEEYWCDDESQLEEVCRIARGIA